MCVLLLLLLLLLLCVCVCTYVRDISFSVHNLSGKDINELGKEGEGGKGGREGGVWLTRSTSCPECLSV